MLDLGIFADRTVHDAALAQIGVIAATPISECLAQRFGHRVACLVGDVLLAGSLAGLATGVDHGYPAIAVCMVTPTIGLRTLMTICAAALVGAMPGNRTSLGAAPVTVTLPAGTWSGDLVASFFHGERVTYGALAPIVGLVAGWGALPLTDSRSTEEPV